MSASGNAARTAAREDAALKKSAALVRLVNLIDVAIQKEKLRNLRDISAYLKIHRHVLALPPELAPIGISHEAVRFWLIALQFETGRAHRRTGKAFGRRLALLEGRP